MSVILSFILLNVSVGQENDAGLWLSANVEKKINNGFKILLTEEIRFNENYSQLGAYFTDIGLQYKISKNLNAAFHYRYILRLQPDLFYETRNRFYIDIAYRYKVDKWSFSIRTRFQDQVKKVSLEESYSQPTFYWRNKLTIKYGLKDFTPFVSAEIFNKLYDSKGNEMDEFRLSAGSEYEFNKKNSINGFFLIDKEINVKNPTTSYVVGIGYTFAF